MTKTEVRQILADVEDAGLSNDALYEVVDGRIVEVSGMGPYGSVVASALNIHLGSFVLQGKLGRVVFETLFRIEPRTYRRPNMAFVSFDRWAEDTRPPDPFAWEVTPDLMIEVVYPTDEAREVLFKIRQYFQAGARAVWLIYPNLEVIHVFDSFIQIRVLTLDDILEGGEVIPGFQVPLASIFVESRLDREAVDPAD